MSTPWLMWGTTVQITAVGSSNSLTPNNFASGQTARVDYGRPERWAFFFSAVVLGVTGGGAAGVDVSVGFDLTIGLGRTQVVLPGFDNYFFPAVPNGIPSKLIWSTSVASPAKGGGDTNVYFVDDFVAQSINAQANIGISPNDPNTSAQAIVEVTTLFCPASHIRPEWFKDGTFNGGENAGL